MFATKSLVYGERVTSEYPIGMITNLKRLNENAPLVAEQGLKKTIDGLPQKQRAAIESLHDAFKLKHQRYTGMQQTNAFGVPCLDFVLLEDCSRINHSCQHNCEWVWDMEGLKM